MDLRIIREAESGSDQSGLRDRNTRLVMRYIRRHGPLACAEIARLSGLSAQTVSNIIRALESEGLLTRHAAVRENGKVGKPLTPVSLNPSGAYYFGLNVGRRAAELVLVDFAGAKLDERIVTYPYPTPDGVCSFLNDAHGEIVEGWPELAGKMAGIGVAAPFELWNWPQQIGAPEAVMEQWHSFDMTGRVSGITKLEAVFENDATSACVAEHLLGLGHELLDFAYFFVGAFVGGGLVLDGRVYTGRTGNAGAFGSLPIPNGRGGVKQLLDVASLYCLQRVLSDHGLGQDILRQTPDDWSGFRSEVDAWIDTTAVNLALASASVASVVEIEAVVVEGAFPADVRARLVRRTVESLDDVNLTGIVRPEVREATVGRAARSIGAALLPIHTQYFMSHGLASRVRQPIVGSG